MSETKVFVLGLDGATFDIIHPMMERGELPHFRRAIEKGACGPLNSTLLHHSPPAWTSFATGRNPGKHGIIGFTRMAEDRYGLRLVNGNDNRCSTLWDELSRQGKKVIVMNIPMTYPPKPLNGLLVSGLDTPSTDVDFTYPKALKQEIFRIAPNYRINLHLGGYLHNDRRRLMGLELIQENIESQRKTVLHLMETYAWDLFAVRFNSPDNVQHQYWAYMDENHPEHNPGADTRLKDAIFGVYRRLDHVVGEVQDRLDSMGSTLIIMSDHGAGPRVGKSIYINEWLQKMGLLGRIGGQEHGGLRRFADDLWFGIRGKTLSFLLKTIPPDVKAKLTELIPWAASKTAGYLRFSGLDWDKTRAFVGEVEGIRINVKDRYPQGTVSLDEYERIREAIIDGAKSLTDPETGTQIFKGVFRREEVFDGPCTPDLPDIILKPNDAYYISPRFFRRRGANRDSFLAYDAHWRKISGSHRQHGILIAVGPQMRENATVEGADILDLFPTILCVMGAEIPSDLDGKILVEAFQETFVAEQKIRTRAVEDGLERRDADIYSQDDEQRLIESLKGLGYID
jgi:predicted AlkP superfamily phosphohydrolase/phosphomutase